MAEYTDFHNHLIPGVDDGARDAEFAAGALSAFAAVGVRQVVATPHFDGSLTQVPDRMEARLAELDAGWAELQSVVAATAGTASGIARVERGVEVMLDVPNPSLADDRLRLAGTRFALVEYPMLHLPPLNAGVAIRFLRDDGWIPVVAHPERYRNLESVETLRQFTALGALLQVNAGSLLGEYGRTAQRWAAEILAHGLASYACSDYHARGEPATGRFARVLHDAGFGEQAELLLGENPGRLIAGAQPAPVPPINARSPASRSWWGRMFGE